MDTFIRDLLTEYTWFFDQGGYDMAVPRPSWVVDTAVTAFLRTHRIEVKESN